MSSSPWILSLTLEEDNNPRGLTHHLTLFFCTHKTKLPQDSKQIKIQAHLLLHSLHERACSLATTPHAFSSLPKKPKLLA
jgi:hypothetical protein